ncbi:MULTISPECIES: PLP-dependent aminotransferase family protein [Streptomyces]|uniref:hypothetical protein n=1 Tax=Streptomyces TaxID=1883 RepID=UPI00163BA618|nr:MULTISPECIES: hypothetical protein [Streptomyces]MBC2879330.1 hypothetical protein [Streptomyces sp. TYQ1024]UBI40073.1 hypothetical protein K7I03_28850 [Streptomyces mobaraensis]UKW32652.1 hypothetical protein MCU78_28780 [Streptomyces sp. TYQ1024]
MPYVPLPQAECLAAFSALRTGTPTNAFEIGEGCNRFPPSPVLGLHLAGVVRHLMENGGLSGYADPFRGGSRGAFAELVGDYLGLHLQSEDVVFVRGGTEAISLIIAYLGCTGHSLTLPLPNYYAFDQCAARWHVPVTAYYRHDGTPYATGHGSGQHRALIEVLPNGITGSLYTIPPDDYDFVLLDAVFQAGHFGPSPSPAAALRTKIRALDLGRGALIMTASKDLSLPGIRAAAVITRDRALRAHIASDAFDRAPVTSPLGSLLMVLYAALLTALDSPVEHLGKLHASAQDTVARHRLPPLPGAANFRDLCAHVERMTGHYGANARMLARASQALALPESLRPTAGYSAFPQLAVPRADFLEWVRSCALDGLHLNPTVVHGGTATAWRHLMPEGHLRLNLSETRCAFVDGLRRIAEHLPPPAGHLPMETLT